MLTSNGDVSYLWMADRGRPRLFAYYPTKAVGKSWIADV